MEFINNIIGFIKSYREYLVRESVKIAVVAMEAAAVYLILEYVYGYQDYAIVFSIIFGVVAYLISWAKNHRIKIVFAIAYTGFAFISAGINVSRDYYKSINDKSKLEAYHKELKTFEAKLPDKIDLNCGQSADWLKIPCSNKQIELNNQYSQENAHLLKQIQELKKPDQESIATIPITVYLKWMLMLLVAIAPGGLFYFASVEDARLIVEPVEIPKTLPDSFNQFSDLLEFHFGFKKTTLRDWLRKQGWIQPSDAEKLVGETTNKHLQTIAMLQEMLQERQS